MPLALALALFLALAVPAQGATWLPSVDLSPQDVSVDDDELAMNAGGDALAMWDHPTMGVDSVYAASRGPGQPFGPGLAISGAGQPAYGPQGALDAAGNAIVVFRRSNGTHFIVQAGFRPAGGSFGPPDDLSAAGQSAGSPAIAMNPAGDAAAAWGRFDGTKFLVQAALRSPGGKFGPAATLSVAGQDASSPDVAIDDAGNAIAVWTRSNGTHTIAQAAFRPAGGAFEAPVDLSVAGQNAAVPQVAMNASGDAAVGWQRSDGTKNRAQWAFRPAGGTFSGPADLSAAGQHASPPSLALDGAGNAVAIWSRSNGTHQIIQYAIRPPGGAFGPGVDLSSPGGDAYSGALSINAAGQAIAVWSRNDGVNNIIQASVKSPGETFGPVTDLSAPGGNGSDPVAGVDGEGSALALWQRFNGSKWIVQAATYDAGRPELREVSVPATAVAGTPVTMSANTFDRWSAVTGLEFAFGDGTTAQAPATGGSVTHVYPAPGNYAVAVTATDAAANTTAAARQIVVTAPVIVAPLAPRLSQLRMAPASFRRGRTARIRFRLDRAAAVALVIHRRETGRRVGGKCVAARRANRTRPRCVRHRRIAGRLTARGKAGANSVRFTGRVGGRRLGRGSYRLTATPTGGKALRTNFRIR